MNIRDDKWEQNMEEFIDCEPERMVVKLKPETLPSITWVAVVVALLIIIVLGCVILTPDIFGTSNGSLILGCGLMSIVLAISVFWTFRTMKITAKIKKKSFFGAIFIILGNTCRSFCFVGCNILLQPYFHKATSSV